jgi:phage tail sheath protein FI
MPTVSPGIVFNEYDFSEVSIALGKARLAIVGAATKGAVNIPTEIRSEAEFVRVFGPPLTTDYAAQAALQFLRKGNSLVFLRVGSTASGADQLATANISVPGLIGGSAAVKATGTIVFTGGAQPSDEETIVISDGVTSVTFEFDDDASITSGRTGVLIGATALLTMENLVAAINASALTITAARNLSATPPTANLTNTTAGAAGNVNITETGAAIAVTGMSSGADAVAPVTAGVVMTIAAKSPGTWGNTIEVRIQNSTTVGAPSGNKDILVYAPVDLTRPDTRQLVERFNNVNLNSADERYVEPIVEGSRSKGFNASQYIVISSLVNLAVPTNGSYVLGTNGGTVGANGITNLDEDDYIGTRNGQTFSGLQALTNAERVEFNLLAVPGVTHRAVVSEMITLVESRGDALALIDSPFGLTITQVIDWHNGVATGIANAPISALNSSYASLNWAWCKIYDPYNKVEMWLPPSGFVAANMAYTDQVAHPWFATAGHNRGRLDALETEYSPDVQERGKLYRDGNNINPIVNFTDGGVTLYGNATLYRRQQSVLAQVHVRRLMIHLQKLIATSVKFLLWEPHDPVTWREFENRVNPILASARANRGLEDFRVICNETTNPPEQRRERVMRGKILLKPLNAVEVIEVDFALLATGAEFDESVL